ncbi:MAG TPA: IPT/TIG domain-containing protein [Acidimicrobiales bacterium]|nr:IPT/TIG domain-containing protein [Acidimicrobiales bacterium]
MSDGPWFRPRRRGAGVRVVLALALVAGAAVGSVNLAGVASATPGWSAPALVDSTTPENLAAVSCPTTTFCMALDSLGRALVYNGTRWSAPVTVLADDVLASVSCASSTLCAAVDFNGQAFIYNGHHWSAPDAIDVPAAMPSVSCAPASTLCIALSGDLGPYGFIYNGTTWSSAVLMDGSGTTGMASVSCPTTTFCLAFDVSGNVVSSTDGGTSWSPYSSVDSTGSPESVSCSSATFCAMVDSNGYAFAFNGTTWSAGDHIDGSRLNSVSCVTSTFCVAVDGHSDGFVTTTAGASWNGSVGIGPGNFADSLTSVSCPSTTFCPIVDSIGQVFNYNGGWTSPVLIDTGPSDLTSVSCLSSVFCVAVDDRGDALTYDGAAWSTPTNIDNRSLVSVSCATETFCVAVDDLGLAFAYDGQTWSGNILDEGPLDAVSCTATPTTFCVAVDGSGNEFTITPGTSSNGNIDTSNQMTSVSCATASFCVTVDDAGNALTWDGSAWTLDGGVNATNALTSVSCTTAPTTFCTAVGNVGQAVAYNGTSWSSSYHFDADAPTSVACATASSCMAVDNGGNALVWDGAGNTGSDWSSTSIDAGNALNAVSCPTATFCVAVDDAGNAVVYAATVTGVAVSEVTPNTGPTTGGTSVTITGSGFTPGSEVDFAGVSATGITYMSANTLTATSPPGTAGTVDVIVTTTSGSSTPNPADQFTYTVVQSPTTTDCSSSCTTTVSTPLDQTQVTATAPPTPSATVSLVVNTDTVDCNGTYNYATAVSTLSSSGFAPGTDVTVTETVGNEPSKKAVKVCYEPTGATSGFFLSHCHGHRADPAPCLLSLVPTDGSVVVTFLVPANDPRFWTGTGTLNLTSFSPTSGGPGKKITIKGKDLTQVGAVVVGGAQARVISSSKSKLVVQVPQGATSGVITVTANSGAATSTIPFTVT